MSLEIFFYGGITIILFYVVWIIYVKNVEGDPNG